MVEVLTGEKAVSSIREEGKGLATHFLQSMKENQLFDILDARVQNQGKKEEIVSIAELARRCLHLNGKRRPTMKEVAVELENINMLKLGTCFEQNRDEDEDEEWNDTNEIGESDGFSSIFDYSEDTRHPFLDEP
ncbi:hypothetical protein C2S52_016340 [Perilla frutescens var. hirtella]|nr:hypothetical protein C2S52_016340 [Perilla frutescens var. hirtella]